MTQPPRTDDSAADPLAMETLRAELAAVREELAAVQAQLAEKDGLQAEHDKWKDFAARAQAELQNAKSRVEREAGELRKFAGEQMIRRILPTLDNFQRAFQHIPPELASAEWVKGVAAIEQDLMRQMADAGLNRMQSLGQPVDPHKHEVLMAGPGAEGTVVEVLEEGYEMHGKVLRPAKVKVGEGK